MRQETRQHNIQQHDVTIWKPLNLFHFQDLSIFTHSRFTNAIKLAVSIGGDSDTIASMTGAMAEAYYGIPKTIAKRAKSMLPSEFNEILDRMYNQI